jgi:hypothetical protein
MSEMIERVARSLCISAGDDPEGHTGRRGLLAGSPYWHVYRKDAIAAIEAMRSPTDQMVAVGAKESGEDSDAVAIGAWQGMIDSALSR